jgi:endonuclease/exonuclease/phosphatase family metal-dependent hydrolase
MVAGMQAPAQANQRRPLRFMTRNLYLGASLTPIFSATSQADLIARASQAWGQVQASNFPARAERLVDEIEAERPDLVGLQEVTLYRISAFPGGPADTVALDFLAELQDEIADRDLPYDVVSQVSAFDGQLPVLVGPTFPNDLRTVRLTDRDVILARNDLPTSLMEVSNPSSGLYEAMIQIPILGGAGGTLQIARGWTSVDVESRDKDFTFLNTHLEAFSAAAQEAQSQELLAGPANTTDPIVMVGDFNSPADGSGSDSYSNIVNAGFSDAWTETMPGDPGYTCCHSDDLMSAAGDLDSRIDIIFFRGTRMHAADAEIVGEEEADKTASGLWPSDHAGVVAKVMLDPRPNRN